MPQRFIYYLILLLIISVFGLVNFRKLTAPYKLITVFIAITFFSESLSRLFVKMFGASYPIYHIYIPLQYFFITVFYCIQSQKMQRYLSWALPIFAASSIINTIFYQHIFSVPSNIVLVSSLIYVLCALVMFKKMLLHITNKPLASQEIFWFNIATLIYYTFTFFCWSFYNYLVKYNPPIIFLMTNVLYFLSLLYYLILGISIYLNYKHRIINKN